MVHPILRKILLSFTIGVGFILTFLVAQFLLISYTGIELASNIASLGAASREVFNNPMLILTTIVSMIVTGGLVMIWAVIKGHIAPTFKLEKGQPVKISKSPKRLIGLLAVLFVVGVITSLIFGGFNDYIASLSPDVNLKSLNALYDAIVQQQPIMIVWIFAAIVVFGVLVTIAGALYHPIQAKLLPKSYTPS